MIEYLRTDDEIFALTLTAHHDARSASYSVLDLDTNELVQFGLMTLTASTNNQTSTWSASMTTASGAAYDRNVKITYNITYPTTTSAVTNYATIVRPYATATRIRALADIDNATTDATLQKLEKRARFSIENYVGTTFLKQYKSVVVYGNNSDILTLPEKIIRVDKVYEDDILVYDSISSASVNDFDYNIEPSVSKYRVKAINEQAIETEDGQRGLLEFSPEYLLFPYSGIFKKDRQYRIVGVWGCSYIPNEIEIASSLLVEDYLCNDWNVRNKNIENIKTDSYEYKYGPTFAGGTGNLLVDSLLSGYRSQITMMAI